MELKNPTPFYQQLSVFYELETMAGPIPVIDNGWRQRFPNSPCPLTRSIRRAEQPAWYPKQAMSPTFPQCIPLLLTSGP